MEGAEQRNLAYVFKLKQTANVKKLIARLFGQDGWEDAGQSWQGLATELRLSGWSKARRVVVLRKGQKKRKTKDRFTADLGIARSSARGSAL